jgi:hypothetical protein
MWTCHELNPTSPAVCPYVDITTPTELFQLLNTDITRTAFFLVTAVKTSNLTYN